MKYLLQRGLALGLASVFSLGLLGGVAALADGDRAKLAQARQAQSLLVAVRPDSLRR
jgi:Na+-translocating ferredoxin:NAD+ oxidoreductase RnfG subunit